MTHHPDHEVELYRTDDAYEVRVDMPGYEPDDIDVRWHDGRLHVSASRNDDGSTRVYNRTVSLPHRVDADAVTATYRERVLEVRLPVLADDGPVGTSVEVTG